MLFKPVSLLAHKRLRVRADVSKLCELVLEALSELPAIAFPSTGSYTEHLCLEAFSTFNNSGS